ncbi:DUF6414 family protein [Brevibacillus laterosporus]|uniref:DUF6414 family protein n=1 Tax=Brevibacillus laterosporus TaxID=1465 RepID=UPI000B9B16A6|nr:hypothetical protein [Brevibacillus laterosporus]MCG7317656.1 hypothetical protein [Brevibacillus laterosporus]MED1789054.1 hypothetical protein [Brevibacillus laterosporus]
MKISKYPIAIYLNQKIIFDLLAIVEDGLSEVRKLETGQSSETKNTVDRQGELGIANVFSFLGIKFKGSLGKNESISAKTIQTEEKVHTPTSLFSKLQAYLVNDNLVTYINNRKELDQINTGSFVMFKGKLETNPLLEITQSFEQIGVMMTRLEWGKGKGQKGNSNDNSQTMKQIKAFKEGLINNGMVDLICTISDGTKAVMPVYLNYFFNNNMNEVIDGEFTVFGKVVRTVNNESEEPINLFRNTSFRLFEGSMFDEMFTGLSDVPKGLKIPEVSTEIGSPSMLVLPISIYS